MNIKRASIICLALLILVSIFLLKPTVTYTYIQSSPTSHNVNPDWENYIGKYVPEAPFDFLNFSKEEIIDILGTPYMTIQKESTMIFKDKKEEILIYMPYISGENKGTTAIYFDIANGNIVDYTVDDCLGIDTSSLPSYFK